MERLLVLMGRLATWGEMEWEAREAEKEGSRREEGNQEPEMKDNGWARRVPPSPASANTWSDVSTEPGSCGQALLGYVTSGKPHHVAETQFSHLEHGCSCSTDLMGCYESVKEINRLAHGSCCLYPHPSKFTFQSLCRC